MATPPLEQLQTRIWQPQIEQLPAWRRAALLAARIALNLGRDFASGRLTLWATNLVYTTLLSLVPMLALSFSVLKAFGARNTLQPLLLTLLEPLGSEATEITGRIINFVENIQVGVLGSVGLGVLVYTVISLVQKIEGAFNEIWGVREARPLARRFSDYLSVLLVGPLLYLAATGAMAAVLNNEVVQQILAVQPLGVLLYLVTRLAPLVVLIAVFSFAYAFIPNTRVSARAALTGGVIAGFAWQLAAFGFGRFAAGSTNYDAIYSGFAIIILLLIWLYLNWLILLMGAQISFYIQYPRHLSRYDQTASTTTSAALEGMALEAMYQIGRHFAERRPPPTLNLLASQLCEPVDRLEPVLQALQERGLIRVASGAEDGYLPARELADIPLSEVLEAVRLPSSQPQQEARPRLSAPIRSLREEIDGTLHERLAKRTLKDLATTEAQAPTAPHEPQPAATTAGPEETLG